MAKVELNPNVSVTLQRAVDEAAFWKLQDDKPRTYLGASIIGHPCARYLWLNFRWFGFELFSGQMLRLFRRGKREEETIVEDLRDAGIVIDHVLDEQLTFDFGCHVIGHPDGFIESGVPEAPKTEHIAEFKTHNDDSFHELLKNGVKEAKPMHWAQMQCGMIGATKFFGHEGKALEIIRRGQEIATADYIPLRLSSKPDWFQCKLCFFHDFCHGSIENRTLPEINCRTCCHFTADKEGKCRCALFNNAEIPADAQLKEQYCHVFHPDMVPDWAQATKLSTETSMAYSIPQLGDDIVLNGADGYSSREIIDAIKGGATSAAGIKRLSEEDYTVTF